MKMCHAGSTKQTALQVKGWKPKPEQLGTTKGKCQNYGKKGYYVKDCWERGSGKEGQAPAWFKQPKEKESAKQSEEHDFAFVANDIMLAATSALDWLTESAATTPIAQNKHDFVSYVDEPSIIKGIVPGATLEMHGHSTVTIEFKVQSKVYSVSLQDIKHPLDTLNNLISCG